MDMAMTMRTSQSLRMEMMETRQAFLQYHLTEREITKINL